MKAMGERMVRWWQMLVAFREKQLLKRDEQIIHPFWVMVYKEIADHVRSWRFLIMGALIVLTCMGSLYTAVQAMTGQPDHAPSSTAPGFFFLQLFTSSNGTLPPFHAFVAFLGPLLGISLGFDAINSEQHGRTLARIMSQPIHRDDIINAKFVAALVVISVMFFALTFLVMGTGLLVIGIPPTPGEFLRIMCYWLVTVVYVAFWLNLSILFSVLFRQAATSALMSIAVWLFFTVFFQIILNLISSAIVPSPDMAPAEQVIRAQHLVMNLSRLSPGQLFSDITTVLLRPTIRTFGPLTLSQIVGAIPNPLPLGQSLLIVWPQITGLIAVTTVCFALSYVSFMRREIR